MFEVLDRSLVSLRGFLRTERTKVTASAGFGISLARIQSVLTGF